MQTRDKKPKVRRIRVLREAKPLRIKNPGLKIAGVMIAVVMIALLLQVVMHDPTGKYVRPDRAPYDYEVLNELWRNEPHYPGYPDNPEGMPDIPSGNDLPDLPYSKLPTSSTPKGKISGFNGGTLHQ